MSSLKEIRVALLEARMSGELAEMVRRRSWEPKSVPAVRESSLDSREQVSLFIDQLSQSSLHTIVFLTGVGVTKLFQEAEQLGRLPELLDALQGVTIACRGPKPSAVLKRHSVPIKIQSQEPYTTKELLDAMKTLDLADTSVAVVHYGERNPTLTQALQDRGARLEELCLYEWLLPENREPLKTLVRNIIDQQVDAVLFTSQIQASHLFLVASELALEKELANALNTRTIVASVGPVCTTALQNLGVVPHVVPEHPKLGHLLKALAQYLEENPFRPSHHRLPDTTSDLASAKE